MTLHSISLDQTSTSVGIILGVLAIVGAVVTHFRWIRPKIRAGKDVYVAGRDSLIGRPAIVDTITGKELSPALPGVGVRLANVEAGQLETRDALRHIATLLESQQAQDKRLDGLESRVHALEEGAVERIVTKAESASAWRAVEAVANGTPPADESPGLD